MSQVIIIPRYIYASSNLIEIFQFNEFNAKYVEKWIAYLIHSHFLIQDPQIHIVAISLFVILFKI